MDVQLFEKDVLQLYPKDVFMESPTELTRYSIVNWTLQYKNISKITNKTYNIKFSNNEIIFSLPLLRHTPTNNV